MDPSKKNKTMFLSDCEDQGKTFSKESSKPWETFFLKDKVKKRKGTIFQKRCLVNLWKKRRWWRWDDIDRGSRSSRSPHNTIFTTHAIWFFTRLSGGRNLAFFLFWMMGKSLCMTTKTFIDHLVVALRFSELPQFQNTLNRGNLSFHHKLQNELNLWHYDRFLHHLEQHHWWIEQLDFSDFGLVSSVFFIWLLFVSVSPSVLLHHSHTSSYRVNHTVIFFQVICFHSKTLQGWMHLASVIWQILSFRSLYRFFAQALFGTSLSLAWLSLIGSL